MFFPVVIGHSFRNFLALACAGIFLAACHSSGGGSQSAASLESFAAVDGLDLAADPAGNLYVVGGGGPQGRGVTKLTASGTASPVQLPGGFPTAVATDQAGNVYVATSVSVVSSEAAIDRLAPDGTWKRLPVTLGDASVTRFRFVSGLAVDQAGNAFIADNDDNEIRRLSPEGILTLLAGGVSPDPAEVDGVGRAAYFARPGGLALGPGGNLYVADNAGQTIRKVTPDGVVTTIAGVPFAVGSMDGTGNSATFNAPRQLMVDSSGDIYVADGGNALIRKIAPDGTVSTIVGMRGQTGFAPGPLPGVIDAPFGLALSGPDLFITTPGFVRVVRNVP
jgi:sugar lactone lactonase YvrE